MLHFQGGEATEEQFALRTCGCHIPGSVQGQAEQASEQPGPVEGSLPMGEGLELDGLVPSTPNHYRIL